MINTYNETSLHKKIKEIYATEFNGKTEQKINNYNSNYLQLGDRIYI